MDFLRIVIEFYCVPVSSRVKNVALVVDHLIIFIIMQSFCILRWLHVFEIWMSGVTPGTSCGAKPGSTRFYPTILSVVRDPVCIQCSGWAHETALGPKSKLTASLSMFMFNSFSPKILMPNRPYIADERKIQKHIKFDKYSIGYYVLLHLFQCYVIVNLCE